MKKVVSLFLTAMLIIACAVPAVFADSVTTQIDFEDGTLGTITRRGGNAEVSNITPDSSKCSMVMYAGSMYYLNDGNSWTTGDFYWQADVMVNQEGVVYDFLGIRNGGSYYNFAKFDNGSIKVNGAEVAKYEINKWYTVSAVVYLNGRKMDFWVDGIKLASQTRIPYDKTGVPIAFNATGGRGYMDNLMVSTDTSIIPQDKSLKITSQTPAAGLKTILSGSTAYVKVGFGTKLDMSTLEGAVSIDNGAVIDNMTFDETTNVLTLSLSNLAPNTYTVTFAGSVADENGNVFNQFTNESKSVSFAYTKYTEIDFNDTNNFGTYLEKKGGYASVTSGSVDGTYAAYLKPGSTYAVNTSEKWVGEKNAVYFKADVKAEAGAIFTCLGTQRYSTHSKMLTMNDGKFVFGGNEVATYNADSWYEIEVYINNSVRAYTAPATLIINGEVICEDVVIPLASDDYANTKIAFSNSGTANGLVDNIVVGNRPEVFGKAYVGDLRVYNASGIAGNLESGKLTAKLAYYNGSAEPIDGGSIFVALYEKTGDNYKLVGVDFASKATISANTLITLSAEVDVESTENRIAKVFYLDGNGALKPVEPSKIFVPEVAFENS